MKYNFELYFDIDDTIADFGANRHTADLKQVIYTPGFFKELKPLPFLGEVNKLASVIPENIHIISACVGDQCITEKIEWLKEYLPAADKENVIFTIVGENKADIALKLKNRKLFQQEMLLSKCDILIDDYSLNLKEWESRGGTAIKFQNSFNTSDPTKYKYIIKDLSELLQTLEQIRKDFND